MTLRFLPTFPKTLARRPFLLKILLSLLSLIGLGLLYAVLQIASRLVGLPEDSPLSVGLSLIFFIAAIVLSFGVLLYIVGVSGSRCRSLGISEWWCVVYFMPYVNVLFFLYLAFWPPRAATPPALDEAPAGALPVLDAAMSAPALPATSPIVEPGATPAPTKNWRKTLGTVLAVLVVLIVSLFARSIASVMNSSDGTVVEKATSVFSDDAIKEYVSGEYQFKVNFPGFPTTDRETLPVEGYDVPMVMYTREIDNGEQAYFAVVWDYEALPIEGSDLDVEAGLNGIVQNIEGAKLAASALAPLGGQDGLEGKFNTPIDGKEYESYARLTIRGKQMYGVWTIGAPYAAYEAFARSFQFMP